MADTSFARGRSTRRPASSTELEGRWSGLGFSGSTSGYTPYDGFPRDPGRVEQFLPSQSMSMPPVDPAVDASHYKHWQLVLHGRVAVLRLRVDPLAPLRPGYELKRNTYDLGVDLELADLVQRLRFEHPQVGCVMITGTEAEVFCAGANIQMLGLSTHAQKVNFCKFTNETRLAMEDASANSGQVYLAAISGSASGGGYELALACDHILFIDDGSAAVSLPEVPLLGVLPGTGGLTRVTDKRRVRRDRADYFCTTPEGLRAPRALEWSLVDEIAPPSQFEEAAMRRASELASRSDRPPDVSGIVLPPIQRVVTDAGIRYDHLSIEIDRSSRSATFTVQGPSGAAPVDVQGIQTQGADFWPLALARELDDAILYLRFNEDSIGLWLLRSVGELASVAAYDDLLSAHLGDWFVREIVLFWRRTLKRLDLSARSTTALIEPGSCFAGTLLELVLAADRSYMFDGEPEEGNDAPFLLLTEMNFGSLAMSNGLSRLESRFYSDPDHVNALRSNVGRDLSASEVDRLGLVTFFPDELDWDDEIRVASEERASFSPDALSALEANLRFSGPETMETKIFGRLSAWQNWVFLRENAAGDRGALRRYGTGRQPEFDWQRS